MGFGSDINDVDGSKYDRLDNDIDCRGGLNSGHNTDDTDIAIAEHTSKGRIIEISESEESVPQICIGVKYDEYGEAV